METLIRQQHIKRRRTAGQRRTATSYTPLRIHQSEPAVDHILQRMQSQRRPGEPRVAAPAVREIGGFVRGFSLEAARQVRPVYAAMATASLLFLVLLLAMQHSGGLPGTWVFYGTGLSAPADTQVVDELLHTQLKALIAQDRPHLPIELDLSKFQQITFSDYTVQSGDTISDIADSYDLRMDTLVSFNEINDARRLQVGFELNIPSRDGLKHVVERGDSLEGIADRYSISTTQLIDANNLRSEQLSIGQELFVPDARMGDTELKMVLGELFTYPVRGRFTSGFGYRNDPFTGVRRFHNGVDWANAHGTHIGAARVGRVIAAGVHPTYGNYVIISHDGGFQSLYAHLHTISVRKGQYVSQGQRVGFMGNTGRSTGTHLHFSIFHNGNPVDPLRYLY